MTRRAAVRSAVDALASPTTARAARNRALIFAGIGWSLLRMPLSSQALSDDLPASSPSSMSASSLSTLLVMSSRRRDIHTFVSSLLDGVGLYLLVNVLAYFAGVVSPAASIRTGGLESSDGGLRVIFPITSSLSTP